MSDEHQLLDEEGAERPLAIPSELPVLPLRDTVLFPNSFMPLAVARGSIPTEAVEKEKAIFLEQAKNEGKPENIAEKIVEGRLEKYYQENCLLEQVFVKNPDQTID